MKEFTLLDPIEQHVVDKVRKFRLDHKLRQHDIAEVINSSTSFVGNVENVNNPSKYNLKHIRMIAEYFDVAPSFFLPEKPLGTDIENSRSLRKKPVDATTDPVTEPSDQHQPTNGE